MGKDKAQEQAGGRQSSAVNFFLLVVLVLCGEAIFALPFHVARFFRPSLLLALDLSHTDLGVLQAAYGLVAIFAYYPGGVLADLFPPRVLLPASLVLTALGGIYFSTLPSFAGLMALHFYWGITTILLFWGALIRATREGGSEANQGKTFGLLEGGRGLLAATTATLGVYLLAPESGSHMQTVARAESLRKIILVYTGVTFLLGAVSWVVLRSEVDAARGARSSMPWQRALSWLNRPRLLLQAFVIVAAYCCYKGIDFYSVYAVEAFGRSEIEGAALSTLSVWIRPIAALGAGLLADRFDASKVTLICFGLLALTYLPAALLSGSPSAGFWLISLVVTTSLLVYAFRALYFALLAESRVPRTGTGTAVGIVSFLGFSPDFFFPALAGSLLDANPGPDGYRSFFSLLMGCALAGGGASFALCRTRKFAD